MPRALRNAPLHPHTIFFLSVIGALNLQLDNQTSITRAGQPSHRMMPTCTA
jgi:hypothetical protein